MEIYFIVFFEVFLLVNYSSCKFSQVFNLKLNYLVDVKVGFRVYIFLWASITSAKLYEQIRV
jgi:hypothetical protein